MSFLFHFGDLLLDCKEPVDDTIDKIHRRCTIVLLLLMSLPLFTKQFAGDPIECFTPTYFTEAQSRYVNSYCWTVSTFYVDSDESTPSDSTDKQPSQSMKGRVYDFDYDINEMAAAPSRGQQIKVSYYQWIPIILLAKALAFYIPFALWKRLAQNHGITLRHLMKRVTRLTQVSVGHPERNIVLVEIIDLMQKLLHKDAGYSSSVERGLIDRIGYKLMIPTRIRLFITFLLIKLLYMLNILLQFYMLVNFFGSDFLTLGLNVLFHLWSKREWWVNPRFPLQTLCSVRAAQQGSLRQYVCNCVLPINVFNEKICSVWWFYLMGLLPITILSFMLWILRLSPRSQIAYVQQCLWRTGQFSMTIVSISNIYYFSNPVTLGQVSNEAMPSVSKAFLVDRLGHDGVFILRLININHGSSILTQIVEHMYAGQQLCFVDKTTEINENPSLLCSPTHTIDSSAQLQVRTFLSDQKLLEVY